MQKNVAVLNAVDDSLNIYADKNMLSSVLCNLLCNAVTFSGKGGNVIVKAQETDSGMIEVRVSDNGIGMDEKLLSKLFKIHEKVGRLGTEGEESAGLGLLLCKGFVEKHGGKIWAESREGHGSTFYFTIPSIEKPGSKKNYN